jgi:hypothetical protein
MMLMYPTVIYAPWGSILNIKLATIDEKNNVHD